MINYIKYLKDNPKGYWFKRKLYGCGWVPAKWQGWLVTLIFIIIIVFLAQFLAQEKVTEYLISVLIAVIIFLAIAFKTGEKPRWSWGK